MNREFLAGIVLFAAVNISTGAGLEVGTGLRIITPDPLLPVSGGMGPTAPAQEKRGELTARALVFRRGDVSVAFVSLDLLGFPSVLCERVLAKVPRIPAANILIGSTHTHSGPDCYAFPDGRGGHTGDLGYLDLVSHVPHPPQQVCERARTPSYCDATTLSLKCTESVGWNPHVTQ